ncbi:hypothetical protein, partial [Myceligenerans halotolerans]
SQQQRHPSHRSYSHDFAEALCVRLLGPIAWCWRVALEKSFPGRRFNVVAEAMGNYGPEITFDSDVRLDSSHGE